MVKRMRNNLGQFVPKISMDKKMCDVKIWYKDFFGTINLFLPILSIQKKSYLYQKNFSNIFYLHQKRFLFSPERKFFLCKQKFFWYK